MDWPPGKSRIAEVRRSVCICGIAVDEGDNAGGLLREGIARCVDEVAADVHQGAAAALDLVADVGRVDVEVAEEADDGAQFADAALVEQFAQAKPLRMSCGP